MGQGACGADLCLPLRMSIALRLSLALRALTRAGSHHPGARRGVYEDAENTIAPRRQFLRSGANQPVSALYLARSVRIFAMRTVCWDETSYDPLIPRPGCGLEAASEPVTPGTEGGRIWRQLGGFPIEGSRLVQIPQSSSGALLAEIYGKRGIPPASSDDSARQVHAIAWKRQCRRRLRSLPPVWSCPILEPLRGRKAFHWRERSTEARVHRP